MEWIVYPHGSSIILLNPLERSFEFEIDTVIDISWVVFILNVFLLKIEQHLQLFA